MQNCLASKKAQIEKEAEEKKSRIVRRSADQHYVDSKTSFADLFKSSKGFKLMLSQYLKLKKSIVENTEKLQGEINEALTEFADESDEGEADKEERNSNKRPAMCDDRLVCQKPKTVLKIKQAILTNKKNDEICSSVSNLFNLNLENMNEDCYNKVQATERLSTM